MIKKPGFIPLVLTFCVFLNGCSFHKAEEKGKEIFPEVKKFDRLMDRTTHKIGYHSGFGAPLAWGSKGIMYGKYLIYMGFNVEIRVFNTPRRTSDAFYRVDQYEYNPTEKRRMCSTLGVISQEQWSQVEEMNDVFKILGHVPIKNEPVVGIEEDLRFN